VLEFRFAELCPVANSVGMDAMGGMPGSGQVAAGDHEKGRMEGVVWALKNDSG
jgi:hypothetical protein